MSTWLICKHKQPQPAGTARYPGVSPSWQQVMSRVLKSSRFAVFFALLGYPLVHGDISTWRVLPKCQSRMIIKMIGAEGGTVPSFNSNPLTQSLSLRKRLL